MKMIVGLGNPGKEYEKTRHNLGFMIIDDFAESLGINISTKKFNGLYAQTEVSGEKVLLLKPLSFMNLSGGVVKNYIDYFKIDVSDILIISDDLDLDFLDYRLRLFGSSGGHNGLKNIEKCLGTNKFKRFRIGISNNKEIDTADYVLSSFGKTNLEEIQSFFPRSRNILNAFLSKPFESVMSEFNKAQ